MSCEDVKRLGPGEARLVANPQSTVLLPRKVREEVVFGVDVVAERARAEEDIDITTIGERT